MPRARCGQRPPARQLRRQQPIDHDIVDPEGVDERVREQLTRFALSRATGEDWFAFAQVIA
jgi:hypothetical protein